MGALLEYVLGQKLAEKRQAFQAEQLQPQATALAKLMAAQGLQADPQAQAAVRMLMDPRSRAAGVELSGVLQGRMDPLYQQELSNAEQLGANQRVAAQGAAMDRLLKLADFQTKQDMVPLEQQAVRALINQRESAAAASRASALAASEGRITDRQDKLNQTFLRQIGAATEVADAVQQIDAALGTGDSLGSLAAVVKLAKVLDPTSVVREGEVTTVQGGTGTAENLIAQYNKLFGQGFSEEGANRFRKVARAVAGPVLERGLRIEDEIRTSARNVEADPEMAIRGAGWRGGWARQWLQGGDNPGQPVDLDFSAYR